jgi:hypothetical protein
MVFEAVPLDATGEQRQDRIELVHRLNGGLLVHREHGGAVPAARCRLLATRL